MVAAKLGQPQGIAPTSLSTPPYRYYRVYLIKDILRKVGKIFKKLINFI